MDGVLGWPFQHGHATSFSVYGAKFFNPLNDLRASLRKLFFVNLQIVTQETGVKFAAQTPE